MSLSRMVLAGMVLVGLVGCGGKPAAPVAENAKSESTAAKQNESPKIEMPKTEPAVEPPATAEPKTVAEPPKSTSATVGKAAGDVRDDNGLKMALVWCPPGDFTKGSPKREVGRQEGEDQVGVTLTKGFWLDRTEVTQGQWKSLTGTEPWKEQKEVQEGDHVAASYVNWTEATEFCRKLTDQEKTSGRLPTGWEYRLPTEAEWEYACRAGMTTAYSFGNAAEGLGDYAWYAENADGMGESYAHAVGLKKPNAWGLFDMHGNVWEWCEDAYSPTPPGGQDPVAPALGKSKVLRGGCWRYDAGDCRSASRFVYLPELRRSVMGFRVALAPVRAAKTE